MTQQAVLTANGANTASSFDERFRLLQSDNLEYVVERMMQGGKLKREQANSLRDEFFQWASLLLLTSEPLVPTKSADDFWHSFLLFTQQYQDWCKLHFGKFIHHVPGHTPSTGWARTIELAKGTHGVDWSRATQAVSCSKCSGSGQPW